MADADVTNRHRAELTLRGLLLGALVTIVFMGADLHMGLKTAFPIEQGPGGFDAPAIPASGLAGTGSG